jgi:hypothetical protein
MIIDNWFASAVGTKMNPDGHYGLQCVDAVDYYAEFIFGVPWNISVGGVNGANNLLDVAPDEYWIRIDYFHGFVPQYGDVLVFAGDVYNQWGHTAVTLSATATRITVVQQDGFAAPLKWVDGAQYSDKPAHVAYLNYSANGTGPLMGVLRPRPEKLISIQLAGTVEGEEFMTEDQLKQYIHETNLFNQKVIQSERETIVNEVRAHTAWNASKIMDVIETIPDVSEEVVKEIKEQLSAGFEFTAIPK